MFAVIAYGSETHIFQLATIVCLSTSAAGQPNYGSWEGLMHSTRVAAFLAIFLFIPLFLIAQGPQQAQLWLTVVDRSALFARRNQPLPFGEPHAGVPTVSINDMQRYQPIEGFGFALTGGSAQLLMKMTPARRAALLKQIFSTDGDGI